MMQTRGTRSCESTSSFGVLERLLYLSMACELRLPGKAIWSSRHFGV